STEQSVYSCGMPLPIEQAGLLVPCYMGESISRPINYGTLLYDFADLQEQPKTININERELGGYVWYFTAFGKLDTKYWLVGYVAPDYDPRSNSEVQLFACQYNSKNRRAEVIKKWPHSFLEIESEPLIIVKPNNALVIVQREREILAGATLLNKSQPYFLVSFINQNIEMEWETKVQFNEKSVNPIHLTSTADGGYLIVGNCNVTYQGIDRSFITKLAPDGKIIFSKLLDEASDLSVTSCLEKSNGDIVLMGNTTQFSQMRMTALLVLDGNGNLQ
ncbi:MAG: hypothetical protein KDC92_15035, partial [Bacteroidetes bacterium]|nr:hypothetical protein [Bacteroidota bacterium]